MAALNQPLGALALLAAVSFWSAAEPLLAQPAPSRASAPAARPASRSPQPAAAGTRAALPVASLGPHAAALEGTWEFRSLSRPGAPTLVPPAASGLIVMDRGLVLAASYLQASPTRTVGSVWEGRMVLTADTFDVIPEKGIGYDSAAQEPAQVRLQPRSTGRIEVTAEGLRFTRSDGGSVTYDRAGLRVQRDPDGTVIVHERTSLTPRIPDSLPGRAK